MSHNDQTDIVDLKRQLAERTAERDEALAHKAAIAEVLEIIGKSMADARPVFERIVDSVARLFDHKQIAIFLAPGDGLVHLAARRGLKMEMLDSLYPLPFEQTSAPIVLGAKRQVYYADVLHGPDAPESIRRAARRTGNLSNVSTPMLWKGQGVGVIAVTREPNVPFSESELSLLRTFADQAVIAIENTRLFEQVQQRTRELSKSLDDLRTAQDRLIQTEKLASLGQLTAGIAHEIKNPLNFVNNFSALSVELIVELNDVLKQTTLADKTCAEIDELIGLLRDNLGKVVQHGKRADLIVKNMLLHSREGSGERRSADINTLVRESLNLAYHGARAEKADFRITLKHDLDPEAGAVDLYPQEITRALLNLISNGFYAAARRKVEAGDEAFEPALSATTKNLGKTVEIRIRDNGTGIRPEVREKMFNPFFTTKPTGEGTGLGLSITHDIIVKQHGGRIDVETEPGVSTEFIITLPRGSIPSAPKPE